MLPIRTERLTVRLMTHDDVATYVAYRSLASTLEFMDSRVPPDPDRAHARVDAMAAAGGPVEDQWFPFAVSRDGHDGMIGDVGVGIRSGGGVAEIGYALRPEFGTGRVVDDEETELVISIDP